MEKMELKWIDRIFEVLECVYKERWSEQMGNEERRNLIRTQWSCGLSGLTATEVKRALTACEFSRNQYVPTVIEFYHFAKGIRMPIRRAQESMFKSNPEIAKRYLNEIKNKIKRY